MCLIEIVDLMHVIYPVHFILNRTGNVGKKLSSRRNVYLIATDFLSLYLHNLVNMMYMIYVFFLFISLLLLY